MAKRFQSSTSSNCLSALLHYLFCFLKSPFISFERPFKTYERRFPLTYPVLSVGMFGGKWNASFGYCNIPPRYPIEPKPSPIARNLYSASQYEKPTKQKGWHSERNASLASSFFLWSEKKFRLKENKLT